MDNTTADIVHREFRLRGKKIHALTAGPEFGVGVLLLHGAKFHSGTWRDLGTIEILAGKGFQVVALDLPGYGQSESTDLEPGKALAELVSALGLTRPVIVSPSMSGRFAFPFIVERPESVAGFVPIAPAGVAEYAPKLGKVTVPSLIVWGDRDRIFPVNQADVLLKRLAGSRKVILPGANHPCYLDRPKVFHDALVSFLDSLKK